MIKNPAAVKTRMISAIPRIMLPIWLGSAGFVLIISFFIVAMPRAGDTVSELSPPVFISTCSVAFLRRCGNLLRWLALSVKTSGLRLFSVNVILRTLLLNMPSSVASEVMQL